MAYVKQTWTDRPSKTTPINAARLNHMEEGIYEASQGSSDLFNANGIGFGRKDGTTAGDKSTAEGFNTTASDSYTHAEGYQSVASGISSHAEGYNTEASGYYTHAEGYGTKATEQGAHAEGNSTEASGSDGSHAEGYKTKASGSNSHAEGRETVASGYDSHAEGRGTIANGECQHAQGKYNVEDTTNTYAHIVGNGTSAERKNIHTLDWNGNAVFAGDVTNGDGVSLNQLKSQIESSGIDLYTSTGINVGRKSGTTSGIRSSAIGIENEASGDYSYAEGTNTKAKGYASHAEGIETIANGRGQHAGGRYNVEDTQGQYLFIIGNGTSGTERKNAMTLDLSGNGTFDGNVICKHQDGSQISMVGMKSQMDGQYNSLSGGLTQISQALSALTERVAALEGNTETTS